jgi:3-oxoacyl-[acyl-carrier protein] reductase
VKPLAGRTAVVTGAARGLGRSCAVALGREGALVVVGYHRRREDAEETVAELVQAGGTGRVLAIDVRDRKVVAAALREVAAEHSGIDILVNNAGVVSDQYFCMLPPDDWNHILDVNLAGTFHCCRTVVPLMMARRRGCIVNIASVAGLKASPGQTAYAAAKGGVIAFTRTLAVECAAHGVRVNAVVPGLIDAGMTRKVDPGILERRRAMIPMGRLGRTEDVDHAIVFLAGDGAAYITGQTIVVDGGLSL